MRPGDGSRVFQQYHPLAQSRPVGVGRTVISGASKAIRWVPTAGSDLRRPVEQLVRRSRWTYRRRRLAVEFYSIATDDEEPDDGMKSLLMGGFGSFGRGGKDKWRPIDRGLTFAEASIFLGKMLRQGRKAYRRGRHISRSCLIGMKKSQRVREESLPGEFLGSP